MSGRRKRILVVDDEPDMARSLSRPLRRFGHDVAIGRDGVEAMKLTREWRPDAVVMDIRMPRMSGIDACLELQKERPELLMILMTGFAEALDEANQSLFVEACGRPRVEVMMKPLDLERLLQLLMGKAVPGVYPEGEMDPWMERLAEATHRNRRWLD